MAHELKKKNVRVEVVNLHPAMRASTDSFIVSNPGQNYTVSELYHCISLREKWLSYPSKKYFSVVVPQLDEGVFPAFVAERQRTSKRQKVLWK